MSFQKILPLALRIPHRPIPWERFHDAIANILITIGLLISIRVLLEFAPVLGYVDAGVFSIIPKAVYAFADALIQFGHLDADYNAVRGNIFDAIGAFILGLVAMICFHGRRQRKWWTAGLAVIYFYPAVNYTYQVVWYRPEYKHIGLLITGVIVSALLLFLGAYLGSMINRLCARA